MTNNNIYQERELCDSLSSKLAAANFVYMHYACKWHSITKLLDDSQIYK